MDKKKTLNLITLGCAKNKVDSEHLLGSLKDLYDIRFDEDRSADIVVINTCGFILDAKQEAVETILSAARMKHAGKIEKLYVFGCLSQRYADELRNEIPEVDTYFGVDNLPDIVRELGAESYSGLERVLTNPRHYAYLKIAEGCNWMCGYCAIPLIRGRYKSTDIETLVEETKYLAKLGVRELILIAQDITYYGLDIYGKRMLPELVNRLSEVEGIEWIRLHYGYPADFPIEIMDVMVSNSKVCHYLDLPFQHISDNMLSSMKRRITKKQTYALVDELRKRVPDLALRTTLLVGYPGETEKDFEELEDFVRYSKFDKLGVFPYSEEEGTYSARQLNDDVPQEVKLQRVDRIMSIQSSISSANLDKFKGQTVRVIVDEKEGDYYIGRTQWDSPEVDGVVYISSSRILRKGKFYDCQVTSVSDYDLYANVQAIIH